MGKVKNEDLRLNIIVNGDAGRKEILTLQRSMLDTKESIKNTEKAMRELEKAGKKGGEQYTALSAELKKSKESLAGYEAEYRKFNDQLSLTGKTINELRQHIKLTHIALNQAEPNTDAWKRLHDELKKSQQQLVYLSKGAENAHSSLCDIVGNIRDYYISVRAIIDSAKSVYNMGEGARDAFLAYDEAMVDAMKTTGLARDEMESLSNSLKKIDTKTAQNELLALVRAGGKLGITGEQDLLGFAKAADQINVALSEDLGGNAEAAITAIGKMTDIFGIKEEFGIEKAMLKVGSAINELGMASTANEGYIVDFSKRLAGIAPNADISISKVMGLAATLDKYGQQSETAATALGQTIMAMFKRTETFAQIAGMSVKDFSSLLENDVNEALLRVLEGMQQGEGGLASVTAAMEEMHLNGQRAATILGTLSKNTGELRAQQELANQAFMKGTSLTEEFGTKNTSLTAVLEKQRKAIQETIVGIGQEINPLMTTGLNLANTGLKLISAAVKYRAAIIGLTVATAAYNLARKVQHFYSAQNVADLALEATLLAGSTKATMLKCAALNILAGNFRAAGIALKTFGTALKANPIGLFIGLITSAIGIIAAFAKKSNEATKSQREFRDAATDTISEINKEKAALDKLKNSVMTAAMGSSERAKAIKKINELYGSYLPNLLTEKSSNAEVASALALVNVQLEKSIRLKGRMNAMTAAEETLQTATKNTMANIAKRYRNATGKDMTDQQTEEMLKALVAYRDTQIDGTKDAAAKQNALSRLVNVDFVKLFASAGYGTPANPQKYFEEIFKAVGDYYKTEKQANILYGNPADLQATTYNHYDTGGTNESPDEDMPTSTKAGKSWSLSADEAYLKAAYELKEKYRKGDIASEEEYRKQLLGLEIKTLEDRIATNKESGADLLSLKSQLTDKQIELQKKDGKIVTDNGLKLKEEQYKLERAAQEARNAEELAATVATGEELEKIKKSQAKKLAAIDLQYLQELQKELEKLIQDSGSPDLMTLDGSAADALKMKLQEVRKQIADILAKMNGGDSSDGQGEDAAAPEKRGKGSLFGVGQDDWDALFKNIAEGKFSLEDLGTTVNALSGAFNEMFKLWSSASEFQAAKEKKQLKDYEKANDQKKKSLEKRLNAGLITEEQYNAQVEQMDAEKDAYQEALELKQAKRQKAQKITQSIINTALGVTKTLAEWGIPWGIAPAAIMGAMGAVETALIAAQPITTGYEEGGVISTVREQDGKRFKARLSPDRRGFISGPTVLVGENGGEYVVPSDGLANPSLQPFLATMEIARRNGTLRSLNFDAIYPVATAIGRASGGYTAPDAGQSSVTIPAGSTGEARLINAIEALERRLSSPITAEVAMLGRNGIVEQTDKYNKLRNRGKL